MQIVVPLLASVETLVDPRSCFPALEPARPRSCPGCGQAAYPPGERLGIVGHGSYSRQVLGLEATASKAAVIKVRRFLCRGCGSTISVLPDLLHPRRWYGAWAILEALLLYVLLGRPLKEVEYRFRGCVSVDGWPSPRRWRGELLAPLWGWRGGELGARGPARSPGEGRSRLRRLLGLAGAAAKPGGGARAAPPLGRGTVHTHAQSGSARQLRRGPLLRRAPRRAR